MSSRYKVLPLDSWMKMAKRENAFWQERFNETVAHSYKEVPRVFNREGQYYDRQTKTYWFEVEGKAWSTSPTMFLYELKMLDAKRLTSTEREALQKVISLGTDKGIERIARRLLADDAQLTSIRNIHRDGYKIRKRIQAKIKERKEKKSEIADL